MDTPLHPHLPPTDVCVIFSVRLTNQFGLNVELQPNFLPVRLCPFQSLKLLLIITIEKKAVKVTDMQSSFGNDLAWQWWCNVLWLKKKITTTTTTATTKKKTISFSIETVQIEVRRRKLFIHGRHFHLLRRRDGAIRRLFFELTYLTRALTALRHNNRPCLSCNNKHNLKHYKKGAARLIATNIFFFFWNWFESYLYGNAAAAERGLFSSIVFLKSFHTTW